MRKTLGIVMGAAVLSTASIGLMATPGGATANHTLKGAFTQTGVYVLDNVAPSEYLIKNTNSQAGVGAGISHVNDLAGKVTDVDYFAKGSVTMLSTLHTGTASATGVPVTGAGTCRNGTGIFVGVKCTFTYTGTLNPTNGIVTITITGTYKR